MVTLLVWSDFVQRMILGTNILPSTCQPLGYTTIYLLEHLLVDSFAIAIDESKILYVTYGTSHRTQQRHYC